MQKSLIMGAAVLAALLVNLMPASAQEGAAQYTPPTRPLPPPGSVTAYSNTAVSVEAVDSEALPATAAPKSITQIQPTDGPPPQFKVNGAPRGLSTGYYGALLLGANFAHEDDLDSATDSASVQPFASIKFGYTWPFNQPPVEQFEDVAQSPGLFFSGGLEIEGMYVRSRLGINTPTDSEKFTLNSGAIMVNAFLKAQSGKFRFYAGPGFGPAFVGYSGFADGGGTDVVLAYQLSAGIDYFITPEWSIFTEYKWFVMDGLDLSKLDFGNMQQHLIGIGVRRSF